MRRGVCQHAQSPRQASAAQSLDEPPSHGGSAPPNRSKLTSTDDNRKLVVSSWLVTERHFWRQFPNIERVVRGTGHPVGTFPSAVACKDAQRTICPPAGGFRQRISECIPIRSESGSIATLFLQHERHERRIWLVVALTAAMMIAEIAGGTVYGSMALVADGWHMSTYASALAIAALAYGFARHSVDDARFSFGTAPRRIKPLSACQTRSLAD